MGFLNALRRSLGGGATPEPTSREVEARFLGVDPDTLPIADGVPFDSGEYDRVQWTKKVKRVLGELPGSEAEWPDVAAEAKAMGFDPEWVKQSCLDEFTLLVRRAVSDRVVTEAEHRKLDLARDLIGIPDAEAVAILESIVADAESFFGGTVEGA
ncbi:hypothetical protein P12x_002466 [Tundrisphaera lichenicola]|uniref:hypothetical protein n=1 Tax=Tundrisphaera lichenicola TaxID=2029860 RepID=UPI003EC0794D